MSSNGETRKSYMVWHGMLKNCYGPNKNVWRVCSAWLKYSTFDTWHSENYIPEGQLTPIILSPKNDVVYSPETTRYVPTSIIKMLSTRRKTKTSDLNGVRKVGNKYITSIRCDTLTYHLGKFKTQEDAFQEYKKQKEYRIKEQADHFLELNLIDSDIHKALHNWIVTEDS